MRQRSIHALGPIVVAVVVLVAAGCGGGGSKTTAATTASATTAPATTAAATTAPATTKAATTTSGLSGLASAANCKQLADLGTTFSQAMGGTDAQDTKKVAQLLQEFAAKTPTEIRPDFQVVADAYAKIADAVGNLKTGSVPDAATLGKLTKLATEIDTAKLTKASENISTWAQKNCHS